MITSFLIRVFTVMVGVMMGLTLSMAFFFDSFETVVVCLLSSLCALSIIYSSEK